MRELRVAFKEENIRAGFKSSGIWPLDLKKALSKLPPETTTTPNTAAVTPTLPPKTTTTSNTPATETTALLPQSAAVEPTPEFITVQVSDNAAVTTAPDMAQLPNTVPMIVATSEATALPSLEDSMAPLGSGLLLDSIET